MNTEHLLKEISLAFPPLEMPFRSELLFREDNEGYFKDLIDDIEEYRGEEVSIELIRLLHQELSILSVNAWLWILPFYLKYCLTPDAQYNQMEIEFLIYALSPSLEYELDALSRLSTLNEAQINCLALFIDWCKESDLWNTYCPEDLNQAQVFLLKLKQVKEGSL